MKLKNIWKRIKDYILDVKATWDYTTNEGGQFGAADIPDKNLKQEKES